MRSFLANGVIALSCVLGASAAAYNSSAYSDTTTGIDFQRWCDEDTGFCFGVALPESVDSDFVGQMVVPLSDSKGWGGVSLSGSMTSALLIAAWADGDSAVSTLRKTSTYANPDVFSGDASIVEIPDGTSVNSTHLTYTFLCSGCIVGSPTTFSASDDTYFFGWALSKSNPNTASSPSSVLPYHAAGFGSFEMLLSQAKSSKYSTWASKAQSTPTATGSASASVAPSASATPTPSTAPTVSNTTYDYIVVGGGPAGIITAERLVEAKKKVILIERGAAPLVSMGATDTLSWNNSLTPFDVPALGTSLSKLGVIGDYLCEDVPGMAGCVLGGGTIVNAMAFIYPQAADFDDKWPPGWKWDDVSDAADRLYERNPGSVLPSADGRRYDEAMYNVLSSFFDGLGWKSVNQQEQPNEKHMMYSYPSWSIADGVRAGPVRSYLPLVQDSDDFSLRLNTMVRRLVRRGGRVTGVEVETASGGIEIINVRAGGKVILAAGAMSTPRILFNSGIGPAEQIKTVQSGSTGITLPPQAEWISLPVGHNLKDHPMFTVTVHTASNFTAYNTSSVLSVPSARDRRLYGQGSGVLAQGGHRLQFWTSNVGSDGTTRFYQGSCSPSADADGAITMKLYLTHGATSSGVLGINAAGSTTLVTDPWLQTTADKDAVTQFLNSLLSDLSENFSVSDVSSASDILTGMTSGDHWVGTAKMGPDDGRHNGTSVVDTNTKVYGTENLHIVDASIHPDLPTGNTQAIVMVAAEAAVARILDLENTPSIGGSSTSAVSAPAGTASAVITGGVSTPSVTVVTTTETVMVTRTSTFTVMPTFS
ncbi:cellobiose dehydrogenase [Aspergillus ambiguus]|uniref:putative cellobiose dehydrogenase n=1 Tax=Aspergillus ambiguus TaxID=176160 RepID=UPI003CCCD0C5